MFYLNIVRCDEVLWGHNIIGGSETQYSHRCTQKLFYAIQAFITFIRTIFMKHNLFSSLNFGSNTALSTFDCMFYCNCYLQIALFIAIIFLKISFSAIKKCMFYCIFYEINFFDRQNWMKNAFPVAKSSGQYQMLNNSRSIV